MLYLCFKQLTKQSFIEQYILIDIANTIVHDKVTFLKRATSFPTLTIYLKFIVFSTFSIEITLIIYKWELGELMIRSSTLH